MVGAWEVKREVVVGLGVEGREGVLEGGLEVAMAGLEGCVGGCVCFEVCQSIVRF